MDNSRQKNIRKIAQELDCGNECYYNLKTNEVISIPDFSRVSDEEEFKEIFRADLEKVNQKNAGFIKIRAIKSSQSFKIMERFVEHLSDQNLKSELQNLLLNKKPFLNFKHKIDQSDFRQSWFDFRQSELEKIAENHL